MRQVWAHDDRAVCTHPGWPALRGWQAIEASFAEVFAHDTGLQFIVTGDADVAVDADTAWIALEENLLGSDVQGTVSALNLFVRTDDGWRLLVHHASPVTQSFMG